METISHIALSRQTALNRQMSIVSNNLANLNTTAYRGESAMFEEVLEEERSNETGGISFVQDVASFFDTGEGPMEATGNPLDMAIHGEGYFTVATDDGARYTRAGAFQLDADNTIVTHQGRALLDTQGNPIEVPENAADIQVALDGTISTEQGELAQLDIVAFENPQNLKHRPDGLYEAEDMAPQPAEDATVRQGMLEGSNVKGVVEMTKMMKVVRSYQGAQEMMDNDHERQLRALRTLVSSQQ